MEPNGRAQYRENPSLLMTSWGEVAEHQAPGSSLKLPYAGNNPLRVPPSELGSDVSNVVNDLGDAKQLAQTRDCGHFGSTTTTGDLVSYTGTIFAESTRQPDSIEPDILSQTEALVHRDRNGNAKVNNYQNLGRKIRAALQTSSWERAGKKFLPIDKLDQIITRKAIGEELQRQGIEVSLVNEIWEAEGSETSSLTTRRKIFAILVLVEKVPAIIDFIQQGLFDNDLPFVFRDGTGDRAGSFDVYRKVKQRDRKPDNEVELQFFQEWNDSTLDSFNQNQWQLLAPFFSLVSKDNTNVSHYNLGSNVVLPFIEDDVVDEPPAQHGGFAEVRRVKIHRAHQDLSMPGNEADHPSYAVKRLNSNNRNAFKSEVDTLKRFSGKNNRQHLINLLLTYYYRGHYHLLFHWADGNLLDYWKTKYPSSNTPVRDGKFARWVCRQWLGVVEGLQAIHTCNPDPSHDTQDPSDPRLYGRHGDLKAENILWFRRPHFEDGPVDDFGSFVISDFGLTRFHREGTKSRVNPETLGRSHSYRPPEYDVRKEVSQKCDIWSLGCVLLEFLHWYALGWGGVQDFQNSRMRDGSSPDFQMDDYFNYAEDPSRKVTTFKKSVKQAFGDLRDVPNTTQFFLDVLDLVQNRLLRMDPAKRANCRDIVETFRKFDERCTQNATYCTQSVYSKPRRASTGLSQLTAPTSTSPREMKGQRDMTSSSEHDSTVQEVRNSEFTKQNGRSNHETKDVPRTQKLRTTSDPGTGLIPKDANVVGEGIDRIMEHDALTISPKKVHFEDLGIPMNDGVAQGDYSETTQKEGMSNENSGRSTEDQEASSLNFAVRENHSALGSEAQYVQRWIQQTNPPHTMEDKEQQAIESSQAQKQSNRDKTGIGFFIFIIFVLFIIFRIHSLLRPPGVGYTKCDIR